MAYACTNIQHVASEEKEEEEDTPRIDTWHNAKVWVNFIDGLHSEQNLWYKGEKYDNKERALNYEYQFPRVPGY